MVCKWADMPDLSNLPGPEAIRELLQKSNPQLSEKQRIAHAGQFWSLVHRMQQGELVVLPLKTTGTIAVGEITGPYRYAPQEQPNLRHGRPVKWITTDLPRDVFAQDLLFSFGAFATVARVKRDQAEGRIRAVIAGQPEDTATSLAPSVEPSSEAPEAEESIDVREVAREEIRQFVSQTFVGHDLARLVGAVLEAQGFSVTLSPPGADQGVDILAGAGALGLDSPRIVVQVKTGQAGFEEFRSLRGLLQLSRPTKDYWLHGGDFEETSVKKPAWNISSFVFGMRTLYSTLSSRCTKNSPRTFVLNFLSKDYGPWCLRLNSRKCQTWSKRRSGAQELPPYWLKPEPASA